MTPTNDYPSAFGWLNGSVSAALANLQASVKTAREHDVDIATLLAWVDEAATELAEDQRLTVARYLPRQPMPSRKG